MPWYTLHMFPLYIIFLVTKTKPTINIRQCREFWATSIKQNQQAECSGVRVEINVWEINCMYTSSSVLHNGTLQLVNNQNVVIHLFVFMRAVSAKRRLRSVLANWCVSRSVFINICAFRKYFRDDNMTI